jgi:hypothetical protein
LTVGRKARKGASRQLTGSLARLVWGANVGLFASDFKYIQNERDALRVLMRIRLAMLCTPHPTRQKS